MKILYVMDMQIHSPIICRLESFSLITKNLELQWNKIQKYQKIRRENQWVKLQKLQNLSNSTIQKFKN